MPSEPVHLADDGALEVAGVEFIEQNGVAPRLRESSAGGGRQQGPGAGESTRHLDRRKIRDRLSELKDQLEAVLIEESIP